MKEIIPGPSVWVVKPYKEQWGNSTSTKQAMTIVMHLLLAMAHNILYPDDLV